MVHVALHLQHSCTYEPLMNHSHLHFHSTTVSNTVTSYTALLPLFPSPSHDTLLHPPHCTNSPPSISHNTPCPFSLSHNTPSLHSPSHTTLPLSTLPLTQHSLSPLSLSHDTTSHPPHNTPSLLSSLSHDTPSHPAARVVILHVHCTLHYLNLGTSQNALPPTHHTRTP